MELKKGNGEPPQRTRRPYNTNAEPGKLNATYNVKRSAKASTQNGAANGACLGFDDIDISAPGAGTRPPRPRPLQGDLSKLPEALAPLTNLQHWAVWRYEWSLKDGRWTKPPINARTMISAKNNDPSTWSTYEEALAAYQSDPDFREFGGIGFMILDSDIAAQDLVNCRDR